MPVFDTLLQDRAIDGYNKSSTHRAVPNLAVKPLPIGDGYTTATKRHVVKTFEVSEEGQQTTFSEIGAVIESSPFQALTVMG